jgi:small ligand-binding sensory domain FIST
VPALPDGADLVFAFVGAPLRDAADVLPARIRERLGDAYVIGCAAGGVIGAGREFEQAPALSVLAGRLPGAAVHGFHVRAHDLPDADEPPRAWHELVGVAPLDAPSFVLVADPFTMPAPALIEGLDYAYPDAVKVGGLASGASRPREQVMFAGDRVVKEGAVGVALMGDVDLVPAVAQGCRPIGEPLRITKCEGHLLLELDGVPVLDALRALLRDAPSRDRELAQTALFLGFEMDPLSTGEPAWLIRNLVGIDPRTRGLYVGETLRRGRRVRFHLRDRLTSIEDLEGTLDRVADGGRVEPEAALLFACLGRGTSLFGRPDHDSTVLRRHFAEVPVGGFFASGEIGPVGRTTHLHGYTSSFALLRPRG